MNISINKLYHPDTLKYCLVLWIGWRDYKLTGFWFKGRFHANIPS